MKYLFPKSANDPQEVGQVALNPWLTDIYRGRTERPNPDGSISTLISATTDIDNGTMLFPTLFRSYGEPRQFSVPDAIKQVKQRGGALHFPSQEEADDFDRQLHEQEYKRLGLFK